MIFTLKVTHNHVAASHFNHTVRFEGLLAKELAKQYFKNLRKRKVNLPEVDKDDDYFFAKVLIGKDNSVYNASVPCSTPINDVFLKD